MDKQPVTRHYEIDALRVIALVLQLFASIAGIFTFAFKKLMHVFVLRSSTLFQSVYYTIR